jgi:diphosphomevalonate decarboxylase
MKTLSASALAHPNIAFIKYWGNRDDSLRLPANGSISMNLDELHTRTTVTWDASLPGDSLELNGMHKTGPALERVSSFLDIVRQMAGFNLHAAVRSENNFPAGAGIASSASAFAALSLAASRAADLALPEMELSRLARHGSGSACRSVPGGFVEWLPGKSDADSYAASIAAPEHWDLVDCIALVSTGHKATGSTHGHTLAGTSPLQSARVEDAPRRLTLCLDACGHDDLHTASFLLAACHALHPPGCPPRPGKGVGCVRNRRRRAECPRDLRGVGGSRDSAPGWQPPGSPGSAQCPRGRCGAPGGIMLPKRI